MALALLPGTGFCEQPGDLKQAGDLNSSSIIASNLLSKKCTSKPIVNPFGMRFNYIKPGTFQMGSLYGSVDEGPVHEVTISKGFYIQTTELTKGQWYSVIKSPDWEDVDILIESPNSPLENVSWEDAQVFIDKLNQKSKRKYRLPTEAEWEYACRAGSKTEYSFGNSKDLSSFAWYEQNVYYEGKNKAQLAGQKEPNAWGLYDMHGNVWEWCQDWFGGYQLGFATDPTGSESGHYRVLRGGSWESFADHCRSANRGIALPDDNVISYGFRLVFVPEKLEEDQQEAVK